MAIDTQIRSEFRRTDWGRLVEWQLSHRSAGWTPAGSCLREQENPVWRVTTYFDGAIHGQAFLTLPEAEGWLSKRQGTLELVKYPVRETF